MQAPDKKTCATCHGRRTVSVTNRRTKAKTEKPCPACQGAGKGYGTK